MGVDKLTFEPDPTAETILTDVSRKIVIFIYMSSKIFYMIVINT